MVDKVGSISKQIINSLNLNSFKIRPITVHTFHKFPTTCWKCETNESNFQ